MEECADNSGQFDEVESPVPGEYVDYSKLRVEVLMELLVLERARLSEAVRMEAERRIVFPETTVIAKDVYRLVTELSRNPDNTAAVGVSEIDVMDVTEIDIVDVSELE